jgi:putative ABC transport system substrate-binding protein
MRRRELIALLGGAAAAWPLAVRAQQPALPLIGFLRSSSLANPIAAGVTTSFRKGLKETGYVDDQNVTIEYRSAEDHLDRLPALLTELISRPVAVIVGNTDSAVAAKAATATVPIVFVSGGDPVGNGLVASFSRPGGNVTGVSFLTGVLGTKRLELLRQVLPKTTMIAMLVYPNTHDTEAERTDVQTAAQAMGQPLTVLEVGSERDIEGVFATLLERKVGALFVGTGPFLNTHGERLVATAARLQIPAIYGLREFAAAGGLLSYAPSITEAYRQAGIYAGRILKGDKPGDLPVMQSTKFELVINLKTAKTLGLEIPPTLLATADEVIE